MAGGVDHCFHCGYSLADTDGVFGPHAVLVERVTDEAGVLSSSDAARVTAAFRRFEDRFPQLFSMLYCGALPPETGLRQFGFWLLNRAAVCDLEVTRPNEHGALFVIDTHGRAVALVLGYFLECYLDARDCHRVLEAGRRAFLRGQWATGVCRALGELSFQLQRRAAQAVKNPGRFASRTPGAAPEVPKFTRIRDGHVLPGDSAPAPQKRDAGDNPENP